MSIKEDNEITVKVLCSKEEIIKILKEKGFNECNHFSMDDYYFIPNDLKTSNLSAREILSKAVIIRDLLYPNERRKMITFKKKDINQNGVILSQKAFNCSINDIDSAKLLFSQIGYYEIMNIKEKDIVFTNGIVSFALKLIDSGNVLIECETNDQFTSVNQLIDVFNKLDLPIERDNYFIKKAEIELEKALPF